MHGNAPKWVTSRPKTDPPKTVADLASSSDNVPPPSLLDSKICGFLHKQGEKGLVKSWKKRWFVFDKDDGRLQYFLSEVDSKTLGVIHLARSQIQRSSNKKEFAIHYLATGRVYLLMAANEVDAAFWITHLEDWKAHSSSPRWDTSNNNNASYNHGNGSPNQWQGAYKEGNAFTPRKKSNSLLFSSRSKRATVEETEIREITKKLIFEQHEISGVKKILHSFPRPFTSGDIHSMCLQIAQQMEYLQNCLTEIASLQTTSSDNVSVTGDGFTIEPSSLDDSVMESSVDDSDYTEEMISVFLIFPAGLILYLFSFLQPEDLAKVAQVCHTWKTYADNPAIWAQFVSTPASKYDNMRNWKSVYVSARLSKIRHQKRTVSMYGIPQVVGTSVKEGWLHKRGEDLLKIWKRRWFMIKDNCLYYFKTPKDQLPCGIIPLTGLTISMVKGAGRKHCFKLSSAYSGLNTIRQKAEGMTEHQRMMCLLSGETEQECLSWITELHDNMASSFDHSSSIRVFSRSVSTQRHVGVLNHTLSQPTLIAPEKKLVLFGVPLADVMGQQQQRNETAKIPVFLERAIKYLLSEKALSEEGLFRVSGGLSEINSLRDKLEQGFVVDFWSYDPHAVSGLIKFFFRELPDRLVPVDLNNYAAAVATVDTSQRDLSEKLSEFRFILQSLPVHNYNLLRALIGLLVQVAAHSDVNKMNENNLLRVITPTIHCTPQLIGYSMRHFSYLFPEDR